MRCSQEASNTKISLASVLFIVTMKIGMGLGSFSSSKAFSILVSSF